MNLDDLNNEIDIQIENSVNIPILKEVKRLRDCGCHACMFRQKKILSQWLGFADERLIETALLDIEWR